MATVYRNGGAGNDLIDGSALTDTFQVQGRAGDDTIIGGTGNDKLYGNEGSDVISGGAGADSMEGGAGDDVYVIARADLGTGKDSILDFEGVGVSGGDALRLTGFSAAATLTFVRQSGDDYIYLIQDGSASGEIAVRHAAGVRLGAGDYQFTGAVPPANRAPVAGSDAATVLSAGPRTITLSASALMANDSDADGNTLRITGVGEASHGSLTFSTNGTPTNFLDDLITYTPTAGYAGADSFTYTLSDGTASVTGTVNITVQAVVSTPPAATIYRNGGAGNDVIDGSATAGPQAFQGRAGDDTLTGGAGNDKLNGNEGNDVLVGGGGADTFSGGLGADIFVISRSDLSGGAESITDFEGAGDGGVAGGDLLYLTGFGAGATLTFVRQAGRDHIYEIRDGAFASQIKLAYDGTALLAAGDYQFAPLGAPANQAPVAAPTPLLTHGNSILSGKLSASDAEGDAIAFSLVTGPANGTLKLGADGAYIYAPDAGYIGADSFRVRLDDGRGGVSEAVISVVIDADITDASPWRDTGAANALVFVHRDVGGGSFYFAADKARVLKGGVEVVGWTEGGAILGVPQGDGYVLETSTGGVVTSRPLAIGVVVVAAGQSNMEGWFTYAGQSKPPEDGVYLWSPTREGAAGHWVSATGAGALAFADTLRLKEPGLPIAFVTGAVGGTKLLPATNVDYWLATGAGTLYQNTIDQVKEASHGQAALLLWNQGEADSASRVDPALYADGMRLLFQRFDTDLMPGRIVISGLAFTRGNADALRAAQAAVAEASALIDNHILYVPTSPAIETWDDTHLTVPARILQGTETALAVLAAEGTAPPGISRQPGGAGNDSLTGGALIDIIQGAAGNDTLNGADGDDILRGETGTDRVIGGAGNDALSGGLDNDTVDGGAGNDDVFGDGGNDSLLGGAGNDQLDGGTGADLMSGQAGDDSYIVDNAGDVVTEVANEGTDTVLARLTYTLTSFVENLILDGTEAINGFGNALANILTGNDGANLLSGLGGNDSILGGPSNDTLDGGDGNDTLTGGSGIDVMTGGAGDDTFYIDLAGDTIIEAIGGGTDTLYSTVTYTLPANVEAIILGGRTPIGATGSDGANTLTGNINGNLLDGAAGNDTLIGLSGNDSLRGGLGNDWLQGGEGVDTLSGGLGADTLTGDGPKRAQDLFVFDSLAESGVGAANRDVVTDFDSMDIFDVRMIDANTAISGDQAFAFIGTAAFTAAGQIRYSVVSGGILIELNVDGNLSADGEILLTDPLVTPTAADFLL